MDSAGSLEPVADVADLQGSTHSRNAGVEAGTPGALAPGYPGASSTTAPAEEEDEDIDEAALLELIDAQMGRKPSGKVNAAAQKKKQKAKQKKAKAGEAAPVAVAAQAPVAPRPAAAGIEFVQASLVDTFRHLKDEEGGLSEIFEVFKRFEAKEAGGAEEAAATPPPAGGAAAASTATAAAAGAAGKAGTEAYEAVATSDDEDDDDLYGEGKGGSGAASLLSRRVRKQLLQDSLAELKAMTNHPEIVESHDVSSPDPVLLLLLKECRSTVPVPRHWSVKRKYLQSKRAVERPPFQLPDFITATGITKLRGAEAEAEAAKSLKSKQRDKYVPKLGRIEVDYNVLRDAFFVHQTRPPLTRFGDLYYEGKENEKKFGVGKRPGVISDRLRAALGMPALQAEGGGEGSGEAAGEVDPAAALVPPPWLVNMQRYGPPPSFPHLRVPGVNAPLPQGAAYGDGPDRWGRAPVDVTGRPLYGDVFGEHTGDAAPGTSSSGGDSSDGPATASVRGARWGEFKGAASRAGLLTGGAAGSSSAVAAALSGGDGQQASGAGEEEVEGLVLAQPAAAASATGEASGGAAAAPDGTASVVPGGVPSGMATPAVVDVRKGGARASRFGDSGAAAAPAPAPALYTVLQQTTTGGLSGGLLGTTHGYIVPSAAAPAAAAPPAPPAQPSGGVEIALAPEELERLDAGVVAAKYSKAKADAEAAAAKGSAQDEDIARMFAEQEKATGKRKRAKEDEAAGNKAKRAKDFKF